MKSLNCISNSVVAVCVKLPKSAKYPLHLGLKVYAIDGEMIAMKKAPRRNGTYMGYICSLSEDNLPKGRTCLIRLVG